MAIDQMVRYIAPYKINIKYKINNEKLKKRKMVRYIAPLTIKIANAINPKWRAWPALLIA